MEENNELFELSNKHRRRIIELVQENPRRHTDLLNELKIAPAEVTRHLQRLVNSKYLAKDPGSQFALTPYGKTLFQQLEISEFINENSKFFDTQDLSTIPIELLSYSVMKEAETLKGPMKVFEKIFQITTEASDFIYCILPEPVDPLILEHSQQLTRGLEMRLIFQEGGCMPTEYSDHRMMSLEIRDMPGAPISMGVTEKEAVVIFPDIKGKLVFGYGLTERKEEFLKWCWLLFEHYWTLGNEIVL